MSGKWTELILEATTFCSTVTVILSKSMHCNNLQRNKGGIQKCFRMSGKLDDDRKTEHNYLNWWLQCLKKEMGFQAWGKGNTKLCWDREGRKILEGQRCRLGITKMEVLRRTVKDSLSRVQHSYTPKVFWRSHEQPTTSFDDPLKGQNTPTSVGCQATSKWLKKRKTTLQFFLLILVLTSYFCLS